MTLNYRPTDRQNRFHASPADICLYGGAAGGGKSRALLMDAFVSVLEVPGNAAMLMRRTFPELEASLILESIKLFPPQIAKYHEGKHRWTIKTGAADSYVMFGFCEREKDVYKYQSAQWGYLGVDESTHFTQFQFEYLFGRVRSVIKGTFPRARLATNPGNVGHGWHRKFFRIGQQAADTIWTPPIEAHMTVAPPTRMFIPSRVYDNPHLMENDPAYIARLEALPPAQRKMLLDGDWDGFAGQYFTEFNREAHLIKPFEIPRHWKLYRSVDFGYTDPMGAYWHAFAENGHVYTFRELYATGLRDKEQAREIKKRSVRRGAGGGQEDELIEYTVGDPSMAIKGKDSGISTQENYVREGVNIFPGSNARVPGWMQLRNFLAIDPATGTPWWQIFENCPNLARELEEAVTDEGNPEDLNTDGSDHGLDSCRYFFMSRPAPATALTAPGASAKLDPASVREWEQFRKRAADITAAQGGKHATLHELNRE